MGVPAVLIGLVGMLACREPRIAGPQRLFAEVSVDGAVLGGSALPKDTHPQPESLVFLPEGCCW